MQPLFINATLKKKRRVTLLDRFTDTRRGSIIEERPTHSAPRFNLIHAEREITLIRCISELCIIYCEMNAYIVLYSRKYTRTQCIQFQHGRNQRISQHKLDTIISKEPLIKISMQDKIYLSRLISRSKLVRLQMLLFFMN